MRIHAAHAMFIHCACHRLQLASVQAAENVTEVKKSSRIFGNCSITSPKKLRPLRSALNTPELKVVKPSNTRWLFHERCVHAIKKELPALIITLQQFYETTGDDICLDLYHL